MILVPVTLLTGFLGSGKSTLLSRLLTTPDFGDTAVIVNEFGDVGLDDVLVEHSTDQLIEMTSGCLCCTIRGDIRETLKLLHERRDAGEISSFRRLVVETTGIADPAPVIHTLTVDPWVNRHFALDGIVTTVDVVNADRTLDRQEECVKQIAVADCIVLTKTDLAKDPASQKDIDRLRHAIRRLNPGADIHDRNSREFSISRLFDTGGFNPAAKPEDVQSWLNAAAFEAAQEDHQDHDRHGHHHHGHAHDVNRHGSDIQAFSLVLEEPVSTMAFTVALELLISNQGEDLLRVKGIVHLKEKPGCPVVIHGVQHIFHDPVWLENWSSSDRTTKIVFITRNISKETIEKFFASWQSASDTQLDAVAHEV